MKNCRKLYLKSGVYQIINLLNSYVYIGSAKDLYLRLKSHLYNLMHNQHHSAHLQSAWNKYGKNNFEFRVLKYIPYKNCLKLEQLYIDNFLKIYSRKHLYNACLIAGSVVGHKTEKVKKLKKEILIFCEKYKYRPSSEAKNKFERRLGVALGSYTSNYIGNGCFDVDFSKKLKNYQIKKIFILKNGKTTL